jgi:collagenase-like PrtC family protease
LLNQSKNHIEKIEEKNQSGSEVQVEVFVHEKFLLASSKVANVVLKKNSKYIVII